MVPMRLVKKLVELERFDSIALTRLLGSIGQFELDQVELGQFEFNPY